MKTSFIKRFKAKSLTNMILSIIVMLVLVARFLRGDYYSVFLCLLTLLLFNIPLFVDKKLNIALPKELEAIILMFIFSAENLTQTYRRMRYVKEYGNYLRLQAVEIERKQKQVEAKKAELETTRSAKEKLLKQGEAEKKKLEKPQRLTTV